MKPELLVGKTFVPTVGPVSWVASVQHAATGALELVLLTTYGPHGHLTASEQQVFLRFEPRVPSATPKQVQSTVRFV